MPINELEKHPFLDYYKTSKKQNYTGLVIGSFPIYDVTQNNENDIRFHFFYGSKDSELWEILPEAYNSADKITTRNKASSFLEQKRLTDDRCSKANQ